MKQNLLQAILIHIHKQTVVATFRVTRMCLHPHTHNTIQLRSPHLHIPPLVHCMAPVTAETHVCNVVDCKEYGIKAVFNYNYEVLLPLLLTFR